jgi:hypothetical protein
MQGFSGRSQIRSIDGYGSDLRIIIVDCIDRRLCIDVGGIDCKFVNVVCTVDCVVLYRRLYVFVYCIICRLYRFVSFCMTTMPPQLQFNLPPTLMVNHNLLHGPVPTWVLHFDSIWCPPTFNKHEANPSSNQSSFKYSQTLSVSIRNLCR